MAKLDCLKCKAQTSFNEELVKSFVDNFSIPTCDQCGNYLKPAITLFEEMLPYDAWHKATYHFEQADLVIVIGSSLEVYPANQLPLIALANNSKMIINTFSTTPLDSMADHLIHFDVEEVWKSILKKLKK